MKCGVFVWVKKREKKSLFSSRILNYKMFDKALKAVGLSDFIVSRGVKTNRKLPENYGINERDVLNIDTPKFYEFQIPKSGKDDFLKALAMIDNYIIIKNNYIVKSR